MRLAETVTFGGSGLNRGATLRGDIGRIAQVWHAAGCRVLPLWRGKILLAEVPGGLGTVPPGHAVLDEPGAPPVFLGIDDAGAVFAQDISGWEPESGQAVAAGVFFDATEQRHPALPAVMRFAELRGAMTGLTAREAELAATARAITGWHQTHPFCARCGARSEPAMAGWQRNCPACGAHHFPRTDPVVIMLVVRGNSLLLGRSAPWPAGMYSLLAGFVEPGETLEAAVRREVAEETGISIGAVRYLSSQPWPFPASLMLGCIACATSDTITIDPTELEDALWITREELVAVFAGQHPTLKPSRKGAIAHFLMSNWLADRLD